MNDHDNLKALNTYFDLMTMNGGVYIFQIAQKMGVFQLFQDKALTVDEVAEALKFEKRPTQLLLEGLEALGLLRSEDTKFSPSLTLLFLKGNYRNLSAEYWDHLPVLLKSAVPFKKMDNEEDSENEYKTQVKALEWMMKPSATVAAKLLELGTKRKECSILDIGTGSGVWSLSMLQEDPSAKVDAIDWPSVLDIAKASAEAAGLKDRFTAVEGNFKAIDLQKNNYDLAIVANVTHILRPNENISLFRKIKRSLKETGELVIFDVFSGQEKGKIAVALYGLGLAIRTVEGTVYKEKELITFLKDASFHEFNLTRLEITPYTMGMLLAK